MFISTHTFVASNANDITEFHRDGTRIVHGPLGSIAYDAAGNARFLTDTEAAAFPPRGTHARTDLAA